MWMQSLYCYYAGVVVVVSATCCTFIPAQGDGSTTLVGVPDGSKNIFYAL